MHIQSFETLLLVLALWYGGHLVLSGRLLDTNFVPFLLYQMEIGSNLEVKLLIKIIKIQINSELRLRLHGRHAISRGVEKSAEIYRQKTEFHKFGHTHNTGIE
jgi:hypothetical protein